MTLAMLRRPGPASPALSAPAADRGPRHARRRAPDESVPPARQLQLRSRDAAMTSNPRRSIRAPFPPPDLPEVAQPRASQPCSLKLKSNVTELRSLPDSDRHRRHRLEPVRGPRRAIA